MTRASVIAVTAMVWMVGLAAAALTYDVTRSPALASVNPGETPVTTRAETPQAPTEPAVMVMPSMKIYARPERPKLIVKPRPQAQLHCSEWRPLQQGYASVQVCD
jgi:hypothetical protein